MLRRAYVASAVITFNILLLILAVNFGWAAVHRLRPAETAPPAAATLMNDFGRFLPAAYPGRSMDAIRGLLFETWSRPVEFEPYTQFRERPYRGQYVNVDAAGFRRGFGDRGWPPPPHAIFVFGGSTTFGYGVADEETIPSSIGRWAGEHGHAAVYNFGRAFYYSSQERILFERLLEGGLRPATAVFIDGYNDLDHLTDQPAYSDQLRTWFDRRQTGFIDYLQTLPAVAGLRARLVAPHPAPLQALPATEAVDRALDTYLANISAISALARSIGVRTLFIWQPVSGFTQLVSRNPFDRGDARVSSAYGEAEKRRAELEAHGVVWCADLEPRAGELAWVDAAHYSASFSRTIATDCIAPRLEQLP